MNLAKEYAELAEKFERISKLFKEHKTADDDRMAELYAQVAEKLKDIAKKCIM